MRRAGSNHGSRRDGGANGRSGGGLGGALVLSGGHAVHDIFSAFLPPLIPVLIERLTLSRGLAGLLTVFLQGPSVLQPFIGHLADRRDLRMLVAFTPAFTAAAMSFLPLAPGLVEAMVLLFVAGVSASVLHAVGPVLVGREMGAKLGRGMGLWMVGGELGRTIGPVVIVSGLALFGNRGVPWMMIAGFAATAVLLWRLRRSPPTGGSESVPPPALLTALRLLRPVLPVLVGTVVARAFSTAAFFTFLPLFLHEAGESLWLAGAALTIVEASGVAGALLGGTLSDRFGRRRVLAVAFVGTSAALAGAVTADGILRLLLLPPLGLVGLSIGPVLMAWTQEAAPRNRSLANGLYQALSFVLRSVAVVVVGAAADVVGLSVAFYGCAAISLLGAPLVLRLPQGPVVE